MKKVYVLPYSATLDSSDFQTGYVKDNHVIYKRNYYPFNKVGDVFTFIHGFFSFDENLLIEKRKELKAKQSFEPLSARQQKAKNLILELNQTLDSINSKQRVKVKNIDLLTRCKNYISYYSE